MRPTNDENTFLCLGYCMYTYHKENDFVASTKRFVTIASADENYCGDNFISYNNMDCYHTKSANVAVQYNCHHNHSGLLRLQKKAFC